MDKTPELELVASSEPRKTLHLRDGIQLHGPAVARRVERPWPRQYAWRELMRRLDHNRGRTGPKPAAD